MSLTTKVADLATRIGTEFKTIRTEIGTAQSAAVSTAAADATTKASAAQSAAISAAATDASTKASAAQAAAIAYADALTTADVAESGNLYFTTARAQAALAGLYETAGAAAAAQSAAQSYADTKVSSLVNGAPALLDTLKELSDALGGDANFASTISTSLGLRVRVDAAQTFTSGQQSTARSNIGAAASADLGDVAAANFVTTFEAALV